MRQNAFKNFYLFVYLFSRMKISHSSGGVHVERFGTYITIKSAVGLTALWNEDDAFMVNI